MNSGSAFVARLGFCLLVAVTAVVAASAQGAPGGAPKLVVAKTEFNAGEVKEGEGVTHAFIFRNEGTAPLEIKKVVLTCGCETVDYDKSIAPGKEGKVTLLVKTATLSGALSKLIVVTTNDPAKPSVDLVMHLTVLNDAKKPNGQAVGAFVVAPSLDVIKSFPVGTTADFALTIYGAQGALPKISKAASNSPKFTAMLEPTTDGTRYVLRVTSTSELAVGRHPGAVKLTTDSKETPEIDVKFEAIVTLPLRISPQSLVFDKVVSLDNLTPNLSKFVWVMQSGGPAVEIKGVKSTLPFMTVERTDNANPSACILRVLFNAIPPKGNHTGKITISTNIPSQPQFDIDVTVNVP